MVVPTETVSLSGGAELRLEAVHARDLGDDEIRAMVAVLDSAFDVWPEFRSDIDPVQHLRWKISSPHIT